MSYLKPDLTGLNPDCKVINHRLVFFTNNQVIQFEDSVYVDSIEASILTTAGPLPLVRNLDWKVNDSDLDILAMSYMKLYDKDFNKTLVKSITITKPYTTDLSFNFNYQRLYPLPSSVAITNKSEHFNVTSELLWDMLQTLKRHDMLLAPVKDVQAIVDKDPRLLEIDIHKVYPENLIIDEDYEVNVPGNITIIRPTCGAFYKDSVIVKKIEPLGTETPLTENVDYVIYGTDLHKTGITSNKDGVYKYIVFIKPYVSTMRITYHAFGGDPTIYDVRNLDDTVNNIIKYVTDSQLLTPETLVATPTISNMIFKLNYLEDEVRRLSISGRPNYGDVSSGGSLLKRIASPDLNLHWWTIAELFKVSGTGDVYVSDIAKFNISTLYTKFTFSTQVNVNLLNESNKLDVTVQSSIYPLGYVPFENYDDLENIIRPQFRIIWNDNTREGSGVYLQIGLKLKTTAEETILIEDVSGSESCWKLVEEVAEAVLPEDDLILLPSKNHTWSKDNPDSRQESYLIPFLRGTICWAGSELLNGPSNGPKTIQLRHFLENDIDISKIKQIRYELMESSGNKFPVVLDVISGSNDLLGTDTFTYNGKTAHISGRIYRDNILKDIKMVLNVDITAGIVANPLYLRHVIVYT